MTPSEVRPNRVTALCAALQGIGGGLGWSVLPPLMQPISAELLGAAHLAILIPALRLPETGTKGRAAAQSDTELSRLAA